MDPELLGISEEMDSIGWNEMVSATQDIITPSAQEIYEIANQYVSFIKSVQTEVRYFEHILKKQKDIRKQVKGDKNIYNEIDEYIKNKEIINNFLTGELPQKIYSMTFRFQEKINLFLGQEIRMIFVYKGADGPELYRITGDQLLPGYNKNKLSMRYTLNSLSKVKIDLDDLDSCFVNGVKNTYIEVLYRWDITRSHHNNVILWQIPKGDWYLMRISSEGDINEAYATIIIQNQQPPTFQNDMEQNVKDFLSYVGKVDSTSGLLEGDTSKNGIEFGIKSQGASALGLKQVYDTAVAIQKVTSPNQIKELLKQKQLEFRRRGRTRNKAYHMANMEFEEILKSLEKEGKKFLKPMEVIKL